MKFNNARRLQNITNCITNNYLSKYSLHRVLFSSDAKVKIGDVSKTLKKSSNIELIPSGYLPNNPSQSILHHLKWIMQKDILGQDIFLVGRPGSLRRHLAMMYLELTKRELEFVCLSRDTTESDLKQRREIVNGSARYIDSSAVLAAIHGRVLILEGIEKAERNVLPVLNNLLENREMQLDDGRFLMAAEQFDRLLALHGKSQMERWQLVRCSEDFRVVALGLPVPRYRGNPLDPPLRSRFQGRDVQPLSYAECLSNMYYNSSTNVSTERLAQLASFAHAVGVDEVSSLKLPDFPIENLSKIMTLLEKFPQLSSSGMVQWMYPYDTFVSQDSVEPVIDLLKKFDLYDKNRETDRLQLISVQASSCSSSSPENTKSKLELNVNNSLASLEVVAGAKVNTALPHTTFVPTTYQQTLLASMMLSHSVGDFCLIGPRGCGKSVLVNEFARLLNYQVEQVVLYKDMTYRDLLQQRTTLPNGDTAWRKSSLVSAALQGSLVILDGLHRINGGTFSVLQRLLTDRELQLPDGTRLLRADRFAALCQSSRLSPNELNEKGVYSIHPSFRIVGLSEPSTEDNAEQWLTSEVLSCFLFHPVRPLIDTEEVHVVSTLVPNLSLDTLQKLVNYASTLRTSPDKTLRNLASNLSTRQILRIAKRFQAFPMDAEQVGTAIASACLSRFLPGIAADALLDSLSKNGLAITKTLQTQIVEHKVLVQDDHLTIGSVSVPLFRDGNETKIPSIVYYDNLEHTRVLEGLLKDWSLGEHLLLIGNQGVGKNKVVDHLLQLLRKPREYVQLHRDTTVNSLTLQSTVKEGLIYFEDSPLLKAIQNGHVLVIDEADKAPTNVTCILKSLVESGELLLSDGRRIVPTGSSPALNRIVTHPDFRIIVLANRPGFPFLGNDFYGALGDVFSVHAVDNPDLKSEVDMLQKYGPSVPLETLHLLVRIFSQLRDMADEGKIQYPYSTRELVHVVKHLEKYPFDGLASVLSNVFDFDSYNSEMRQLINETLIKNGVPVNAKVDSVNLANEIALPALQVLDRWQLTFNTSSPNISAVKKSLQKEGPIFLFPREIKLQRVESRAVHFTEEESVVQLPIDDNDVVSDVALLKGVGGAVSPDRVLVASLRPIGLFVLSDRLSVANFFDLSDLFPLVGNYFRPRVRLLTVGESNVLMHEETLNELFLIDLSNNCLCKLRNENLLQNVLKKFSWSTATSSTKDDNKDNHWHLRRWSASQAILFNRNKLQILDVYQNLSFHMTLPFNIAEFFVLSANRWLMVDESGLRFVLQRQRQDAETNSEFVSIEVQSSTADYQESNDPTLFVSDREIEHHKENTRLFVTPKTHFSELCDLKDANWSTGTVRGCPRLPSSSVISNKDVVLKNYNGAAVLKSSNVLVRHLPNAWLPTAALSANTTHSSALSHSPNWLEVIDVVRERLRYVPLSMNLHGSKQQVAALFGKLPLVHLLSLDNDVAVGSSSSAELVSVDQRGCLRWWTLSQVKLNEDLYRWQQLIGEPQRRLLIEREASSDILDKLNGPKHGKEDPNNVPHVGGNTWAGGRDTAGLGGVGGPYRLDAGHDVHQVPDSIKNQVPEHVRQAAREVALKAWKKRLREIEMSEYDAQLYESYAQKVSRQTAALRSIFESLYAKGKERHWLRHQSHGELDDSKLVDGLLGERSIYRRRGERPPEVGEPQSNPKHLRLLVDCSGSMYRFNGHDGRLERQLEACLMLMEAMVGHELRVRYDIFGHSGEGASWQFVGKNSPPENNKQRLAVLKSMIAHAQFCMSGDHTLEGTSCAIRALAEMEQLDERFLVVLSDANLDRYGISPQHFGRLLTSNPKVNAFAIFIGSLGNQAEVLKQALPSGHAFVCMNNEELPNILQHIFSSTILVE